MSEQKQDEGMSEREVLIRGGFAFDSDRDCTAARDLLVIIDRFRAANAALEERVRAAEETAKRAEWDADTIRADYAGSVAVHDKKIAGLTKERDEARDERDALRELLDTPEVEQFDRAVPLESAHQVKRWGSNHDAGKEPQDWFWLVGYLAGKALASAISGDTDKAKHHCISSAAVLRNWHAYIRSGNSAMRPGISEEKQQTVAPLEDEAPPEPNAKCDADSIAYCFCVCHSRFSGRPACIHCKPELFKGESAQVPEANAKGVSAEAGKCEGCGHATHEGKPCDVLIVYDRPLSPPGNRRCFCGFQAAADAASQNAQATEPQLTRRQTQILRACLKDEIVESGGRAAVGNLFISSRTIIALLNCCAIREDAFGYYQITATGREILKGRP